MPGRKDVESLSLCVERMPRENFLCFFLLSFRKFSDLSSDKNVKASFVSELNKVRPIVREHASTRGDEYIK